MEVRDLTPEHHDAFCVCLDDWSDEMKEAGPHKAEWLRRMDARGLRAKLAFDDAGALGGLIQYLPIEESFAEGRDLYFVLCIWVHGHRQGRGNFQKRGLGKALLQAAEQDARERGARGMAAWGLALPFWMKASWFKKQGYRKADRDSIRVLMWKPFVEGAEPPRWIRQRKKPEPVPGKVTVTAFINGWCPVMNLVFERAKRAAAEFDDRVVFQEMSTFDRDVFLDWGIADGLFINGREMRTGPPPKYEKIRKAIAKALKRL